MRMTYTRRHFQFRDDRIGVETGTPTRLILHIDGSTKPHTAEAAMRWGNISGAFTIHGYVDGLDFWTGVPETRHAFHVLESRVAAQRGFSTMYGGRARGDIRAIGWEHKQEPDGTISQDTRITSVLAGADLMRRWPHLIDAVSEHAEWDPWTRQFDMGDTLYIPDWVEDVKDVLAGRTPWRTVGVTTNSGTPPVAEESELTRDEIVTLINDAIRAQVLDPLGNWQTVIHRTEHEQLLNSVLQRIDAHSRESHGSRTIPEHRHHSGGVV